MKKVPKRTRKLGMTPKQILEGLEKVYIQLAFLDGSHIVKSQEFSVNYRVNTTKELSFIDRLEEFFEASNSSTCLLCGRCNNYPFQPKDKATF